MEKTTKKTIKELFAEVGAFLSEKGADAELVKFVEERIEQLDKAAAKAKERRVAKGGDAKDVSQSEFYTTLREKIYPVLTTEDQTGADLLNQIDNVTPNGKEYMAAQVATALKPLIEDGSVVKGKVKAVVTGKDGLTKETLRTSYKLA